MTGRRTVAWAVLGGAGRQSNAAAAGETHRSAPAHGGARRSLRSNFSWTLLGSLAYSGGNWIQLAALTKALGPADVGSFAFALALSAPIMIFLALGLRTVQVTDATSDHAFGDYLTIRTALSVIGVGIAVAGGYARSDVLTISAIAVAKALDGVSDIVYGLFQRAEQMDVSAKAMMINSVVSTGLVVALVMTTKSVVWAAIGVALGSAAALVAYALPAGRVLHARSDGGDPSLALGFRLLWRPRRLLSLICVAAPLGLASLLTSLNPNIPRFVIERDLGRYELGIYAALASILVIGTTLMGSLVQAVLPRLTSAFVAADRSAFTRLIVTLLTVAVALGAAGVVAVAVVGEPVVAVIFTDEYARDSALLVWLSVALALGLVVYILDVGMSAARRFQIQVPINLATVAFSLVGSLLLIERYGIAAAGAILSLSLALQVVMKAVVLGRSIRSLVPATGLPG